MLNTDDREQYGLWCHDEVSAKENQSEVAILVKHMKETHDYTSAI